MTDHHSYAHNLSSCKLKPEKYSGQNGIQTHDLCNTDAALYQLSYQVNWELVTLRTCNISVDGEEYIFVQWIYERSYKLISTLEKDMKTWLIIAVMHTM